MDRKRPHSEEGASSSGLHETGSEETLSMLNIMAEQCELEEIAAAVGGDKENCSYSRGYVKRQPLFACKTCAATTSSDPTGVCLACALHCHENHDLIELYTKRNFRCDCGNTKFPINFTCRLESQKADKNEDNKYNQNFEGTFCSCERPYPDPEVEEEDDMLQCCVCEDWYHYRHLGTPPPEEYTEMICDSCVEKHDFVTLYANNPDFENVVDGECSLLKLVQSENSTEEKQITTCYFDSDWRSKLCQCSECTKLYQDIPFLTDLEDTVDAYEQKNISERKPIYDQGMEQLSRMDPRQQVEIMSEYHNLRSELRDFLARFARSGEVVTQEHIAQFFEMMNNKKRRRVDIPPTCR